MQKTLELTIKVGESVGSSRHLSGRRRTGLPVPECPLCHVAMFCMFSIDGRDENLAGSPLSPGDYDYDLFVFPCLCYPYQTGYFTRVAADGAVEIRFMNEGPVDFSRKMIPPYPVAPVAMAEIPFLAPRDEGPTHVASHRICPNFFDYEDGMGRQGLSIVDGCPFCDGKMQRAMVIDSDYALDFLEQWDVDLVDRSVLMWGDEDFLGVTLCSNPSCRTFGYKMIT